MGKYKLKFVDKIADGVHGIIPITQVERDICNLAVFRRLAKIKHLSFSSFVFPSAEHTRFIHSLGVMHIIDKMAISLGYNDEERQLVRLAGLLHDIGHFPLSHDGEISYIGLDNESNYYNEIIKYNKKLVKNKIDNMCENINKIETNHMKPAKSMFHHEQITKEIILNNIEIKEVISKNNCDSFINLEDITAMITGDVKYDNYRLSDKVQLLHSEMDADRIDYSMRDAYFTGTSYGDFGFNFFIDNLELCEYEGIKIVCVKSRGVVTCDQFLINRLFSYEQVVYNRRSLSFSFMAQNVFKYSVSKGYIKSCDDVMNTIKNNDISLQYFTDRVFWNVLEKIHYDHENGKEVNEIIYLFVNKLMASRELHNSENSEIVLKTNPIMFKNKIKDTDIYRNLSNLDDNKAPMFLTCDITKHRPIGLFEKAIENETDEIKKKARLHRLIDSIVVIHKNGDINAIVDDDCSVMSTLYDTKLYLLREYEITKN